MIEHCSARNLQVTSSETLERMNAVKFKIKVVPVDAMQAYRVS
jgi:hypothetical protein